MTSPLPAPLRRPLAAGVALAAALACVEPPPPRPDVALISLDTLRADHLSCYGYERETSPFLDRLASEGVRFANAIAPASNTAPSHMSLLTGLDPFAHGIRPAAAGDRSVRMLSPENRTLAEVLRDNGYQTLGLADSGNVMTDMGFGRGFDEWHNERTTVALKLTMLAKRLEAADPDRPLFVFFHTYEPHAPYLPPPPYRGSFTDPDHDGPFRRRYDELVSLDMHVAWRQKGKFLDVDEDMGAEDFEFLRGLYDEGIAYTDSRVRRLWQIWSRRRDAENTLFVVVSDHGEGFMERGTLGHKYGLYRELLHVPLILRGAGLEPRVVEETVSLTDFVPTLLDLLEVPSPRIQGRSFLALARGEASEERPAFSQLNALRGPHDSVWVDGEHLLRWQRSDEENLKLYDLDDLREENDLVDQRPDRARSLRDTLEERRGVGVSHHERAPSLTDDTMTEQERQDLEALGYVDDE